MLDPLENLNEPQRQAVCHIDGPLLVLAGAGSGKTRVITRRVAYLISLGVPPGGILAITFTNKAAGEMRQRVEGLCAPRGATIATFHSLCARLLREFAPQADLASNFSIYDADEQLRCVKDAIEALDSPGGSLNPAAVLAAISDAKNKLIDPQRYGQQADDPYRHRVAEVYNQYQRLLASNNALDFDDLLFRLAVLMRDRPEIRLQLARRFRYIMIDEYQDTNHAQYVIAHGIAMEHENIAVTGDPDQSIYAWRGADINNILEFEKDYPNAVVVRLEENYRSTKMILSAASRLIARNVRRKEKALWTRRPGGTDVHVTFLDDEHAEARYVAQAVEDWRRGGGKFQDVAVFYRVNALSRVVEEALIRSGIPYRIARGVEFYNRKEIKDVLAYLRLMINPADDLSCQRIINSPPRGIGQATVSRLREFAAGAGISLMEACRRAGQSTLAAGPAGKVAAFAELIGKLSADVTRPVREIMEDVLVKTGLEEMLRNAGEANRQARANVEELVSSASEFDAVGEGMLADFLHRISLVSDVDYFEGAGGAVTLTTLHAAKGLEFPRVFIIGCEDGLLPFQRDSGDSGLSNRQQVLPDELEEERRLAFVGMTRARDGLTLTAVRRRMLRGQRSSQTPSPFLAELSGEMVTVEDATTVYEHQDKPGKYGRGGFYADVDERALIEALENAATVPPEYEHLREGCMVRHPTLGVGRLIKLKNAWPETRAIVDFHQGGRKTFVLRAAKLELI